jgi:hypothetical protein
MSSNGKEHESMYNSARLRVALGQSGVRVPAPEGHDSGVSGQRVSCSTSPC